MQVVNYFTVKLDICAHNLKLLILMIIILVTLSCEFNNNQNPRSTNEKSKKNYKKVLMIGNSFTFYWNLPQVLERMFATKDVRIKVDQKTIGGSKLSEHWYYNKNRDYNINEYDYVVFNDYSTYAMKNLDTCAKYIKLFTNLANKLNVKPFIYGTWEYPYLRNISSNSNSNTMSRLDSIAKTNKAIYVPVGNAFKYAEDNYPEINLYMDDNKHPSPNATYLAACVFYSMITGDSPLGLPRRFEGKNIDGKKIYYIITETKAAEKSQEIADIITSSRR